MANFTSNSLSYLDHNNDLNWDLLNPFTPNISNSNHLLQNSIMDYQTLLGFSSDHFLAQQSSSLQQKMSGITITNTPPIPENVNTVLSSYGTNGSANTSNKRKAEDFPECSSLYSSSPLSSDGNTKKNNSKRGKKTKRNEKGVEKPNEVVHVRARRGQATDSHSIAERVRRGKINERLKCLQDIVPGCNNKTMGMAVMLDEIINYVQSLQNQVEFLSLKLTAASQFHDFNVETEPEENRQKMNGNKEVQDIESTIMKRGYDQDHVANFFQPTWPF